MLMEMWHTQKRYPRGETFYTQCTAVAVAVHCGGGCSALRWRLKCTAVAVAVHCRSGCSALRPKPALSGVALQIFLLSLTHVRQSPFDWQKPVQGKTAVRDT